MTLTGLATAPILHVDMDAFYASVAARDRPEPARRARDRRRRPPRGGAVGQLPRPGVRRPLGDADDPGPPAVPAGGRGPARLRHLRAGLVLGDGDLPPGHPAGRGALARRGVPRRPRLHPPARLAARDRRAAARHHPRRAGHHLLGRGGGLGVGRQARQPPGQARRRRGRAARRRSPRSCTRSTSASCGGWGRRPRRCCTGSAWSPSATSPTPRCAPCSARSATTSAATCTSWPGAPTGGRSPPGRGVLRPGRGRPRQDHGRRRDLRPRHRRPRGDPARAAAAVGQGRPAGCGWPGWPAAPSPSRSGSPTSPRSPAPAPSPRPPT